MVPAWHAYTTDSAITFPAAPTLRPYATAPFRMSRTKRGVGMGYRRAASVYCPRPRTAIIIRWPRLSPRGRGGGCRKSQYVTARRTD